MFESIVAHGTPGQPPAGASAVSLLSTLSPLSPLSTVDLEAMVGCLAHLEVDVDDAQRITQLGLLERIKGAAAAAQARVSVDFETSQRREQADAGLTPSADIRATPEYKKHLARVLTRRAIEQAV